MRAKGHSYDGNEKVQRATCPHAVLVFTQEELHVRVGCYATPRRLCSACCNDHERQFWIEKERVIALRRAEKVKAAGPLEREAVSTAGGARTRSQRASRRSKQRDRDLEDGGGAVEVALPKDHFVIRQICGTRDLHVDADAKSSAKGQAIKEYEIKWRGHKKRDWISEADLSSELVSGS